MEIDGQLYRARGFRVPGEPDQARLLRAREFVTVVGRARRATERGPRRLDEDALLRIEQLGLARRDAEEQRIDIEVRQQRDEDRHEDHDDLGPLQRPAQHEDQRQDDHRGAGDGLGRLAGQRDLSSAVDALHVRLEVVVQLGDAVAVAIQGIPRRAAGQEPRWRSLLRGLAR